jgi:hypothetical protein
VVRRMVEEYHYRGGALVIDTERVSAAESVDRVLSVLQPRRGDRD